MRVVMMSLKVMARLVLPMDEWLFSSAQLLVAQHDIGSLCRGRYFVIVNTI